MLNFKNCMNFYGTNLYQGRRLLGLYNKLIVTRAATLALLHVAPCVFSYFDAKKTSRRIQKVRSRFVL